MELLTGNRKSDMSRLTLGPSSSLPKIDISSPGAQQLKGKISLPQNAADDLARKQMGLKAPASVEQARGTADRAAVKQSSPTPLLPQQAPQQPLAVQTETQTAPQTPLVQTPPTQVIEAPDPRRQALESYISSLQKTPEEIATEESLARARESEGLGQLKIRGQAIPQDLIIGQGALLRQQAELGQQTLEQRLARQQANRQLQALGEKARLDFETNIAEQGGVDVYTPGTNPTVDAYVQQVQQGALNLENVPQGLRNLVAQGLAARPETQSPKAKRAVQQADTALNAINSALSNPSIDFSAIRRVAGSAIPGSSETDLVNQINTIKALIGFDQLQQMREASPTGGALGQVSERELSFLQSVAGSLNINQSTEQLKENLMRIQKSFQTLQLINSPDGTPFTIDGTTYIKQGEQLIPQDFSGVGGDTNQALNRPQRNRNPGNVKAGGVADQFAVGTDEQGHLIFPSEEAGFQALRADLQAKIQGNSRVVKANPTIAELGKVYAEDPNWANAVSRILGVDKNTRTANIDFNKLVQAIARQEGFYA